MEQIGQKRGRKISLIIWVMIVLLFLGMGRGGVVQASEEEDGDTLRRIVAEYNGKPVERGEEISLDDITVYAYYYEDKSKHKLDMGTFTISPDVMRSSTTQLVTVTYTEGRVTKKTTISVPCNRGSLKSISAVYVGSTGVVGTKVDKADVKVTAELSDGFREKVEDFTMEDHVLQAGNNTISISYSESGVTQNTELIVYAMEATLSRIEAIYLGGVLGVDGYVNPDQIQVIAYYRDAAKSYGRDVMQKTVNGAIILPYALKEGNNTITVVYSENGTSVETRLNVPVTKSVASWEETNAGWKFHDNRGNYYTSRWLYIDEAWYYFDENGLMQTNRWIYVDGAYYFLDQNGRCVMDGMTPDGYFVDGFGAWIEN